MKADANKGPIAGFETDIRLTPPTTLVLDSPAKAVRHDATWNRIWCTREN